MMLSIRGDWDDFRDPSDRGLPGGDLACCIFALAPKKIGACTPKLSLAAGAQNSGSFFFNLCPAGAEILVVYFFIL